MAVLLGILNFIFCTIGVFFTCLFVLSCIGGIINPQIEIVDGKPVEKGDNARIMFAIIMSIAWGLVVAL